MTENEMDSEKLRMIEAYCENQASIECLKVRIERLSGELGKLAEVLDSADDLADAQPTIERVVHAIGEADIKEDRISLAASVHQRRSFEGSLRSMNLGALIKRP